MRRILGMDEHEIDRDGDSLDEFDCLMRKMGYTGGARDEGGSSPERKP